MLKTCTKCGKQKPQTTDFFSLVKNGKGGLFFRGCCIICERLIAKARMEKRRVENKDAIAAIKKRHRTSEKGKEAHRKSERRRWIRKAGGEEVVKARAVERLSKLIAKLAHRKEWPLGEPARKVCWLWNNPKLSGSEKFRVRYAMDEQFQIRQRLRRQLGKKSKQDGVADLMRSSIRNKGESGTVKRMLGYSIAQLREHLERQFTKGMNWEEFKAGRIHIDHIIPQSAFNLQDEEQWRKCWCLSNLRPMWARENIIKSDKVLYLL